MDFKNQIRSLAKSAAADFRAGLGDVIPTPEEEQIISRASENIVGAGIWMVGASLEDRMQLRKTVAASVASLTNLKVAAEIDARELIKKTIITRLQQAMNIALKAALASIAV